jgi:hypothetical protein
MCDGCFSARFFLLLNSREYPEWNLKLTLTLTTGNASLEERKEGPCGGDEVSIPPCSSHLRFHNPLKNIVLITPKRSLRNSNPSKHQRKSRQNPRSHPQLGTRPIPLRQDRRRQLISREPSTRQAGGLLREARQDGSCSVSRRPHSLHCGYDEVCARCLRMLTFQQGNVQEGVGIYPWNQVLQG